MRSKLAAILLYAVFTVTSQGGCSPAHTVDNPWKRPMPDTIGKLDVQFLGIKEGEATLVRFGLHAILIDTGTRASVQEVIELLNRQRVRELDALVLTNSLEDYCGGAREIIHSLSVKQVAVPALTGKVIVRQAGPFSCPVRSLREGNAIYLAPGIKLTALFPVNHLFLTPEDNSLVLQMTYNKIKILFASAIHQEGEQMLLRYNLHSQILKVGAEGVEEATSEAFIEKVDPQAAVIFNGTDRLSQNEVIRRLSENWSDIYLIQKKGTVHVITDGTDYSIYTEK